MGAVITLGTLQLASDGRNTFQNTGTKYNSTHLENIHWKYYVKYIQQMHLKYKNTRSICIFKIAWHVHSTNYKYAQKFGLCA